MLIMDILKLNTRIDDDDGHDYKYGNGSHFDEHVNELIELLSFFLFHYLNIYLDKSQRDCLKWQKKNEIRENREHYHLFICDHDYHFLSLLFFSCLNCILDGWMDDLTYDVHLYNLFCL